MSEPLVIAIDGPAASGKGTLARRLADYFHLPHLDTGLTYRAVAHMLIDKGWSLDDEAHAIEAARQVDLANLNKHALSAHRVGEAASRVAIIPELRRILVEKQRAFARNPGGAVLDGRDIGTVIAPEAEVKLFVIASVPARAERRFREMQASGRTVTLAEIAADLEARDRRDRSRVEAPLVAASDAVLLDTSDLPREAAIAAAIEIARTRAAALPENRSA